MTGGKAVPSNAPGHGPADNSGAVGGHFVPAVQSPGGKPEPYMPEPYHAGRDETVKCPVCGKMNSPDARFCDQSGDRL